MNSHQSMNPRSKQKVLLISTAANNFRYQAPFSTRDENTSFSHLAMRCLAHGIDLHVTHGDNLIDRHTALAWVWRGVSWRWVDVRLEDVSLCYADLPPNPAGATAFRRALGTRAIPIVNSLQLSDLLTDKLATHNYFSEHVPLTWRAETPGLVSRLRPDRLHPDLSADKLFFKPRYGERGRGIYIADHAGLADHPALRFEDYLVQAFLETRSGIPELGISERHDLRLLLRNGELVQAFARVPATGSYLSNFSQGGRELPIKLDDLPSRIRQFAAEIDASLSDFGPRFFSLDVGIGRSGKIWIYELNTMPDVVWDDRLPEGKPRHRLMHELIAAWLDDSGQLLRQAGEQKQRPPGRRAAAIGTRWPRHEKFARHYIR